MSYWLLHLLFMVLLAAASSALLFALGLYSLIPTVWSAIPYLILTLPTHALMYRLKMLPKFHGVAVTKVERWMLALGGLAITCLLVWRALVGATPPPAMVELLMLVLWFAGAYSAAAVLARRLASRRPSLWSPVGE